MCAHAKAKCLFQNGSTKCERCHRLKKECRPSPSVRGSGVKRKSGTKTARLEEKLDGLVSLLTAAPQTHVEQSQLPTRLDTLAALAQFGASPDSVDCQVPSPGQRVASKKWLATISPSFITKLTHRSSSSHSTLECIEANVYFYRNTGKPPSTAGPADTSKAALRPDQQDNCRPDVEHYQGGPYSSTNSNNPQMFDLSTLPADEAQASLSLFQNQMLQQLPFIKIPGRRSLM